jgi:hypothetical protein
MINNFEEKSIVNEVPFFGKLTKEQWSKKGPTSILTITFNNSEFKVEILLITFCLRYLKRRFHSFIF